MLLLELHFPVFRTQLLVDDAPTGKATKVAVVDEQICMDLPTRIWVLQVLFGKALVHRIEFDAVFSAKFHGLIEFFCPFGRSIE